MEACELYFTSYEKPLKVTLQDDELLRDWRRWLNREMGLPDPEGHLAAKTYRTLGAGSVTVSFRDLRAVLVTLDA